MQLLSMGACINEWDTLHGPGWKALAWGKPYKPYVDGWGERKQPPDEWEWELDAAWIMLIP